MPPAMENKPLIIPESKKWKGLVVYCNKCKRDIKEICFSTGNSLRTCTNAGSHIFKVYVHLPGTRNQRKTKKLETRDINEAVKQTIEFEKQVKLNLPTNTKYVEPKPIIKREELVKPRLLIHALARYISWLKNEGVPAHQIKERQVESIKDVELAFKRLVECLNASGYDLNSFEVESINDNLIGVVFEYIEKKSFANRTFNKHFSHYTSFLSWYIEEYNSPVKNWFERVKRKRLNPKPQAITKNEFEALLNQITPENGIREYENGIKPTRSVYRSYLKSAYRLALETGLRRENVVTLKWNNIKSGNGIPFVEAEDIKVNRIQNRTSSDEKKIIQLPVTEPLKNLLNELGWDLNRNSSSFILEPNLNIDRKRVMSDILSKAFSHYYNQLNTGRELTFKSLRKAYLTSLDLYLSKGITTTQDVSGHSSEKILETNYIDKKLRAQSLYSFRVFGKEDERSDELQEIRNDNLNNQKQLNREV